MLRNIRVVPLAAESLGVRSMCTYVETPDIRLLLDAGVSLCPNRFGLPPHPQEFKAIDEARKRIAEAADKADVVTISHYHYDHHTPSFEDWLVNWTEANDTAEQIYRDKTVLVKNARENINFSQRERGWMFVKTGGKRAGQIINADAKSFTFGQTRLRFSEPVFHGSEKSGLGWVLMTTIETAEEKFLFAPDVQGPMSSRSLRIIEEEEPGLLMIGGPPLYLSPLRVSENELKIGLENLVEIVAQVPRVILDHHLIRDEDWQTKTLDLFYKTYQSDSIVQTAAQFLGEKDKPLEAMRKKLYTEHPPTKEFDRWKKANYETKTRTRPPI